MNVFLFIGLECDEGSMNRLVLREEKELNLNNVDCTQAERGRGCVLEQWSPTPGSRTGTGP